MIKVKLNCIVEQFAPHGIEIKQQGDNGLSLEGKEPWMKKYINPVYITFHSPKDGVLALNLCAFNYLNYWGVSGEQISEIIEKCKT